MLENWSFRRDNLAVLRMIRAGMFGEIVHCHSAHSHDCIDHWFFDPQGNLRWGGEFLIRRNCDQYPTHGLGPVLSWMDINRGDAFSTVTSTATDNLAGVRGVGEGGTLGPAAVLANAVADALAPLGIEPNDLPMTPARVWAWCASRRPARSPSPD